MLLLVLNLLTYMDRQVLAGVESLISKELLPNDPNAQGKMGLLATYFLVSYMVFAPIFGILGDKTSRWLLIALGTIVGSIATGATGLAHTFGFLVISRCFVGVSEAAYAPIAPTLLADLSPENKRGQILSLFYAAIPVGSALGYTFGGVVSDALSWHYAFILLAPPGILAGLIALLYKDPRFANPKSENRDPKQTQSPTEEKKDANPHAPADLPPRNSRLETRNAPSETRNSSPPPAARNSQLATRLSNYLHILSIPSYLLATAGMAAMTFALGGIAFWMPRYIHDVRHVGTLGQINFYFGAIAASTGLVATLTGGWASDKLRTRFPSSYFLTSAITLAIGFPLFLLVLYLPFPLAWVPLAMAVFMLFFNTGPTNAILANVIPAPLRATAFALNIFLIHLFGDAVSPPLIGAIADRWSLQTALALTSTTFVLGAAFWFWGAEYLVTDTAQADAQSALT
jgi:MFS family permease